jgi:hypothetical protein
MKNKISAIIGILICFGLSRGCISDHIKGADKNAIANYEKMISDNSVTTATLFPEYKEVTMKILGAPVKTYEFKYHYNVNGVRREGKHTFHHLPTSDEVRVHYLKSDPEISVVDPHDKLNTEKNKSTSNEKLYWGIGWGILGLATLYGFIKELREKKGEVAEVSVA